MAISQQNIFSLLSQKGKVVKVKEERIDGIVVENGNYKARFASFSNCNIRQDVVLSDVDLSVCLKFESCQFKEEVTLRNVRAQGFEKNLNGNSESIVFKNCRFVKVVQLVGKQNAIERKVLFENCFFAEGILVEGFNITSDGLTLRGCTIERKLDIFFLEAKGDITLSSNVVNTFVRIETVKCSFLNILKDNSFNDRLHIKSCVFSQGIIFNEGTFRKEVDVVLVKTGKTGLQLHGSTFEKAFYVAFHYNKAKPIDGIYSFYLNNSKFLNGIYVNGKDDLFAGDPYVENITIELSAELKGDIVFRNLHLGILSLSGFNSTSNLLFNHLFINQIKIAGMINNAGLIFSGIKSSYQTWYNDDNRTLTRDNAIYIDDCNFGKAQFFQTDLSSFGKVVFHNNILTEISTSLVKWFTPSQLDSGDRSISAMSYQQAKKSKDKQRIQEAKISLIANYRSKQEIYRQLKYASQKQGDNPQTLEFQRWEMDYYRKIVNLRRPRNWDEVVVLWSNQSNDFGQSWLRALSIFLCLSFLFYIPVGFLNTTKLDYSHFARSWSAVRTNLVVVFVDNIKNWFTLMNPAHGMKDLNEKIANISGWIYFWDFLSRIIASYFIFQIVSAFRKFNK